MGVTPGFVSGPYNLNYIGIEASGAATEAGKMDNLVIRGGGMVSEALTVNGIAPPSPWRSIRTFDVGGAGTFEFHRPFDIQAPPASVISTRTFDIEGAIGTTLSRPFDIEGSCWSP